MEIVNPIHTKRNIKNLDEMTGKPKFLPEWRESQPNGEGEVPILKYRSQMMVMTPQNFCITIS